jgi:predicted AAA+ superfamily ATPase
LKLDDKVLQVYQDLDKFALLKYLQLYSLPSVLSLQDETEIYQQLNMIIRRIISHDLSSIKSYSNEVMSKVENLLFLIASSDTLSLHSLSANLGININTLSSILDTLLQAQMLIKVPAYGSATKMSRKPAKYLFSAPALRSALVSVAGSSMVNKAKGKALEDFVFSTYRRLVGQTSLIRLSYDSNQSGADLIYQSPLIDYVMEIGWNKKSSAQLLETMKRSKIKSAILLTQTGLDYDPSEQVLNLPLEYFALL